MLKARWFAIVAAVLLVASVGCGKGQKSADSGNGTGTMSSSSGDSSGAGGNGGGDAAGGAAASKSMSSGAGGASSGSEEGTKPGKGEVNEGILHTSEGWVLTEDDNGKYLVLHPGEMVIVRVGASKGNGYKWEVGGNEGGVLSQVGKIAYAEGSKTAKTDGTETSKYKAMKMGETTVQMKYLPPYSKTVPERVLNFTVAVK
jgi:predicted secreted protein